MKNKGFTMIELLATIVIIGILSVIAIASVQGYKEKAQKEDKESYEKSLIMAAESYYQANKSKMPKAIGNKKSLTSTELKTKRYLKEDKGGCVEVSKDGKTKYTYKVDMNCTSTTTCSPTPVISRDDIYVTDIDMQKIDMENFNNVKEAFLVMKLSGGTDSTGKKIEIDGYSYTISVKTRDNGNLHEVYNSGTLSANGNTDITITRRVADYIDIAGVTYMSVTAKVINKNGCEAEQSTDPGEIHDDENPVCINVPGAPSEWINKDSPDYRTITVGCDDGKGSGCVRSTFTRTWPNDYQQDAEWGYIEIRDNAGNTNRTNLTPTSKTLTETKPNLCNIDRVSDSCRVRVNVDKTMPQIKILGATAATSEGKKGTTNIYQGSLTTLNDGTARTGSIGIGDHKNLVNTWMNKKNYPNGVIYEIEISDNIHLDTWKWETNPAYITSATASNYSTYSTSNDRYAYEDTEKEESWNTNCGLKKKVILIGFNAEGRRKGVLTVKDKAGNTLKLTISANLDRTPPRVPTVKYTNYDPDAANKWSKVQYADAYAEVTTRNQSDVLADGGSKTLSDNLSGWKQFEYKLQVLYDSSKNADTVGGKFIFDKTKGYEGKHKIAFRSRDNANNESNYSTLTDVWVDYTAPSCKVTRSAPRENDAGWVGLKSQTDNTHETVTVSAKCVEDVDGNNANKRSGCKSTSALTTVYGKEGTAFEGEYKTNEAGAQGIKKGGSFVDVAGNKVTCEAKQKVYSDYHRPRCTISGEAEYKTDHYVWRKSGTTITRDCVDDKGTIKSGCVKKNYQKQTYNKEGETYKNDTTNFKAVTIRDKAGNANDPDDKKCSRETMHVYVDKQKPSCKGSKSNQHSTSGVNISYSCGDHGGSGVKNCPGSQTHKKSTQSHSVCDNVKNCMTCTVTVTAYNQYRYIKKNVAKTCSKSCCGNKTCTKGSCCGWYTSRGRNCRKCGSRTETFCNTWGGLRCPSGYTRIGWCPGATSGASAHCRRTTCNTCTWNTGQKTCTKACCGYKTCTNGSCCGWACGSQWTSWGAGSTGCRSQSRKLYK